VIIGAFGGVLLIWPIALISRKLYPAIFRNIYSVFPSYLYWSETLLFIGTDVNGILTVKKQLFFKPKTKDELEEKSKEQLLRMASRFGINERLGVTSDELIKDLIIFYESPSWNPFYLHAKADNFIVKIFKIACLGAFLGSFQIFILILYLIWPIIMLLRIPLVLLLMMFYTMTNLIFLRRSWNLLVYFWTLDVSKIRDSTENDIDTSFLHYVKLISLFFETIVQVILQFGNAFLIGKGSMSYYLSLAGAVFNIICSAYRYFNYCFCKGGSISDDFSMAKFVSTDLYEMAPHGTDTDTIRYKPKSVFRQPVKIVVQELRSDSEKGNESKGGDKMLLSANDGERRNVYGELY